MLRLLVPLVCAALTLPPSFSYADDESRIRSQQDIIRDRARACKGMKGQAMTECQATYVGPRDEKAGTGGWRQSPNPRRTPGRS